MSNGGWTATTKSCRVVALAEVPYFHLDVPGVAVAKGRPRMTRSGHVYTPAKTREYEERIRLATRITMAGRKAIKGPCFIHVAVFFEAPASLSKRARQELFDGGAWHVKKPDLDNIVKSAIDGITGDDLVILDDKQIVEVCTFKTYAESSLLSLDVFEVGANVDRFAQRWREWEGQEIAVSPI